MHPEEKKKPEDSNKKQYESLQVGSDIWFRAIQIFGFSILVVIVLFLFFNWLIRDTGVNLSVAMSNTP